MILMTQSELELVEELRGMAAAANGSGALMR
jgi:hypothetical protein